MRVLGLQTSHLLLIRTNLGYGTVLTAACARQGCSASGLFVFFLCPQNISVFRTYGYDRGMILTYIMIIQ
jgi:hypothetical protein